MPATSMYFTPSRRKNHGMSSMQSSSDICPKVIFPAALVMPISLRKGLVKA